MRRGDEDCTLLHSIARICTCLHILAHVCKRFHVAFGIHIPKITYLYSRIAHEWCGDKPFSHVTTSHVLTAKAGPKGAKTAITTPNRNNVLMSFTHTL